MSVLQGATVGKPRLPAGVGQASDYNLYPKECVERKGSYLAPVNVDLEWSVDADDPNTHRQSLGEIPIMVMVRTRLDLTSLLPNHG